MRILAFRHGDILETSRGSFVMVEDEEVFQNVVGDQDLVYTTNNVGQAVFVPEGREVLPQLVSLVEKNPDVLLAFYSKDKLEEQTEILRLLQSKLFTIGLPPVPFRLMPAFDSKGYREVSSDAPQFRYVNSTTLEITDDQPTAETVDDFIIVAAWGRDYGKGNASVRRALEKAAQHYAALKGIEYSLDKAHSHIFDDRPEITAKAEQAGWQGHLISYDDDASAGAKTLLQAVNDAIANIKIANEAHAQAFTDERDTAQLVFTTREGVCKRVDVPPRLFSETLVNFNHRFQTFLEELNQREEISLIFNGTSFAECDQEIRVRELITASAIHLICRPEVEEKAFAALDNAVRGDRFGAAVEHSASEGAAYGVTTKPSLSNYLLVGVGMGLMCGGLAAVTVLTFGAALLPALILSLGSVGGITSGAALGATLGAGLGYLAHSQGFFAKPAPAAMEGNDEGLLLSESSSAVAK